MSPKSIASLSLVIAILLVGCATTTAMRPVTGNDVIQFFKGAGLEAENARPLTEAERGKLLPDLCPAVIFDIPSQGDKHGRVFVCADKNKRDAVANYFISLRKANAMFWSWVYVKGSIVVQLNGEIDEAMAKKYEAAIPE